MRENDHFSTANPFRVSSVQPHRSPKQAFASALKLCLVAACALSVTLVLASQSRRWLLYQLSSDFDSLSTEAQTLRLNEIAALGQDGVPFLIQQLSHDNRGLAEHAFTRVSGLQQEWALLDRAACQAGHELLLSALSPIVDELPEDRTGWATTLLQQTLMEFVDERDIESRSLHLTATDLLARCSLTSRLDQASPPSGASGVALVSGTVQPITVQREPSPLNLNSNNASSDWTEWPPQSPPVVTAPALNDQVVAALPETESLSETSSVAPVHPIDDSLPTASPTNASGEANGLRVIPNPRLIELEPLAGPVPETKQISHVSDAPFANYDLRSVILWLASDDVSLRRQAELELLRRGFQEQQVSIARRLTTGDVTNRLEMLEQLVHDDSIDPRPWLLWLLEDEHREIKLRAVNILATIPDPVVRQTLRHRMTSEPDQVVAARIRRVLDLR